MVQSLFTGQFGALSGDKQRFHEVMRASFGDAYNSRMAERYRQLALAQDFSWLPPVRWVDSDILEGARGAHYPEFDTVFLDRSLQRFPSLAATTFAEVAGHVLALLLNPEATPAGRGMVFRRMLDGAGQLQARLS
jgi:hypothetical protein